MAAGTTRARGFRMTEAELDAAKEKAFKRYVDSKGAASIKTLSRLVGVPLSYINRWIKEEDWYDEIFDKPGDKNKLSKKMERTIESGPPKQFNLTEQEELFCHHYLRSFNIVTSAARAGYRPKPGMHHVVFRNPDVEKYINYLKGCRNKELFVDAIDIVRQYIKIAFADMTDFVIIKGTTIRVRPVDEIDGQLIESISETKEGIKIKLQDKMVALSRLEKYFGVMPKDWKQVIEEKKLELMEKGKFQGIAVKIVDDIEDEDGE